MKISLRPVLLLVLASPLAHAEVTGESAMVPPDNEIKGPLLIAGLRGMSTDRPDVTESPFTVDAGHFQVEADLASNTRNDRDGVRSREWSYGATNVRYGVSHDFELGCFVAPWTDHRETSDGRTQVRRGFGDVVVRGKLNFWGNDGGRSAGGLIVDIKIPTASGGLGNGAVEGTVFAPLFWEWENGWDVSAMVALDLRRSDDRVARLQPGLISSVSVGRALTKALGMYAELASETGIGPATAAFDIGLTYQINADTEVDVGVNVGLNSATDAGHFFAGIARRF
jgi:hypothetical protein